MKKTFYLLAFLFHTQLLAQPLPLRLTCFVHELDNNTADSTTYTYTGGKGSLIHTVTFDGALVGFTHFETAITWRSWQQSAYALYKKQNQLFDTEGRIASIYTASWNTSLLQWENTVSDTFTYGTNHLIATKTSRTWAAGIWAPDTLLSYNYTGTQLTEVIIQFWNTNSHAWNNARKQLFSYDANGYLLVTETQLWQSIAWNPDYRISVTLDTVIKIITQKFFKYIGNTWQMEDEYIDKYYYQDSVMPNPEVHRKLNTANNSWYIHQVVGKGYTASKKEKERYYNLWDTATNGGINDRRYLWTFGQDDQVAGFQSDFWAINQSAWYKINAMRLHYQPFLKVSAPSAAKLPFTLYPIPAANILYINLPPIQAQTYSMSIYNINGALLRNWTYSAATPQHAIPVGDLPIGTYMLTISTPAAQGTQPFIIAR